MIGTLLALYICRSTRFCRLRVSRERESVVAVRLIAAQTWTGIDGTRGSGCPPREKCGISNNVRHPVIVPTAISQGIYTCSTGKYRTVPVCATRIRVVMYQYNIAIETLRSLRKRASMFLYGTCAFATYTCALVLYVRILVYSSIYIYM